MTETSAPITGRNSLETRKVSKALWVAKTVGLCMPQQSLHNYANFGGVGAGERSVLWAFKSWQCFVVSNIIEVRSSRERIVSNILLLFSIRSYTKIEGEFPLTTLPGADPGFFLGGGALVSCSASTPINHFFGGGEGGGIPVVLENRRSSQGGGRGVSTPCTLPLDPPLITLATLCATLLHSGAKGQALGKEKKSTSPIPFPLCFPLLLFYITPKVQLTFLLFTVSFKNFS